MSTFGHIAPSRLSVRRDSLVVSSLPHVYGPVYPFRNWAAPRRSRLADTTLREVTASRIEVQVVEDGDFYIYSIFPQWS